MKLLLDDGDEHVGADGAPDLRLHRVLAGAQKLFNSKMLLDPFEEQLDLPAVQPQRLTGIQLGGSTDQTGGEVSPDAPITPYIGIGKCGAPHRLTQPHGVEFGGTGHLMRVNTSFGGYCLELHYNISNFLCSS